MAPAMAQTSFTPRDESPEEFVAGAGRDETFYACTACHGFKLVAQQGLTRAQWDELAQPDDPPPRHAAARGQGSRDDPELSGNSLSAARGQGRLGQPVREVSAGVLVRSPHERSDMRDRPRMSQALMRATRFCSIPVIASAAKQSISARAEARIASRSLSSGAHRATRWLAMTGIPPCASDITAMCRWRAL